MLGKEALLPALASLVSSPRTGANEWFRGGFHRSEQTSLPWLTLFLAACWKSPSLCLAALNHPPHTVSATCEDLAALYPNCIHVLRCGCLPGLFQFEAPRPGSGLLSCPGGCLSDISCGLQWSVTPCPTNTVRAPRAAGPPHTHTPAQKAEETGSQLTRGVCANPPRLPGSSGHSSQ